MHGSKELTNSSRRRRLAPVVETMPADLLTPLAVYLKLSAGATHSFLLESVNGGESISRYSFVGANPEMTVTGGSGSHTVAHGGHSEKFDRPMLEFIRAHFDGAELEHNAELPLFSGGAIGYFGFDCADWFEPSLRNFGSRSCEDDAVLMFFTTVVAFDHARQQIKIVSLVDISGLNDAEREAAVETASAKNADMRSTLEHMPVIIPPASDAAAAAGDTYSNWTRADFEAAVVRIKELILAGECYQVVLSQCFLRPTNATPVAIYRALRALNPSPYMFLLNIGPRSVIGASPEMLVRARGEKLNYRPIAGTRRRGATDAEDALLAAEMKGDPKEVAEHMMLVDLGRNDLGRVSEYGSVAVDHLMEVEKYSHVQHMVSQLSSRLRPGCDRFDALAACFPAGTVSGAPKVRAIEIIRDLEPTPRGHYAGAVGYMDYAGNMDTCITIRTLVLEGGIAKVQAGAGIVADSLPAAEFEESENKARALLRAVEIAEAVS